MAEVEVWSLKLEGGAEEAITPPADIRITNISFGEDLADANGRSVIKLGYNAITADDLEEKEEEEEDTPQGTYTTTVLAPLTAGRIEQAIVNLVLLEDRDYVLSNNGKNVVYLTGNYIKHDDEDPYGDGELDSDEEGYDLDDVSSDVEMNPEDLEALELESNSSRFEEVKEEAPKSAKRGRESDAAAEKPKEAKEKKNKKLKAEDGKAAPAPAEEKEKKEKKKEDKPAAVKELPGGLQIKDTKVGDGAEAKKGARVGMRYIGKLNNGNVFDKNVKGKPFYFRLGKGEVIKGWDQGIAGMKVGGERVLTIPPGLAYGKQKLEGIPPNSTLTFEVKLLEVK
ncbi:FKBP-like protein [Coprinellus micaceus]|uniref:peptidylprolyl isomerase n=1 Tax=Coprinellus micaceus TaxID=71717 RepID=A0A4Y7TW30_COPMI|nr:FKBP-like protein [Coprinellus micaceus]